MSKKTFSRIMAMVMCSSALFSAAACGGDKGGSTGGSGSITVDPLTVEQLGEGFNSAYLPDKASVKQFSGKIDVCLDFEGTQEGWKALATEYQRLQGNGVIVNVNTNYSGTTYSDRLNNELTNLNTDWDIVEGNLGYGSTRAHCIDMYPAISSYNPYCGKDVKWSSVLKSAAYKTKEADNSGESYILNTEVMQTCWFINDVAFEAAVAQGYKNADGEEAYPITWNDLIVLCEKMEAAGYTNPLGITLCDASVKSLQFTWLLRVYGDYYYRQFYQYIMTEETWENYDATATVVENNDGYGYKFAKILNMLFEKDSPLGDGYIGFTSDLYRDFVGNLAKMKGHLMKDVSSTEFGALRDEFETQSDGMGSPQIMLDYQGFGINYEKATTDSFSLGYFDYPTMESDFVPEETITRDIGGNGGFLSVINHVGNPDQNELNKDFVKFVMSPYGQTIYYKGLAAANAVPKGLTSIKDGLVVVPQEWTDFFNKSNETITFSGDVDANQFLSWGVRYANGYTNTEKVICEYWRNLLMTGLSDAQTLTVAAFASRWDTAVRADMADMVAFNKWPNEFWKDPNYNL